MYSYFIQTLAEHSINNSPFSQSSSELTVIWWYSGKSTHPWNRLLPAFFWISGSKYKVLWYRYVWCHLIMQAVSPKSPDKSITVKQGYNELMLTVKWFSFPVPLLHVVTMTELTNYTYNEGNTSSHPWHFVIGMLHCTYLTKEFQHSINASNSCFVYAIQVNITILTNICKFYTFKRSFSIKKCMKIWHFDKIAYHKRGLVLFAVCLGSFLCGTSARAWEPHVLHSVDN